jgi:beta-glucosidase
MPFASDFAWGVATASYQIEGAPYLQGGGRSVWDMFCARPDKIKDASNGDIACDHFHRYAEDAALMGALGIPNYRFSISWPRVIPQGTGAVSQEGLGFYDRLVDALLAQGVSPWVTLFHWDEPTELYYRGGWLNRDSADWFAEYTQVVVDRLGDRVSHWMTLNEPQCFIGLGRWTGEHAPGDRLGFAEILRAMHHTLLAHGKACQVIRARNRIPARIGWAPVGVCAVPAGEDVADVEAARRATFACPPNSVWSTSWLCDPVLLGHYPEEGLRTYFGQFAEPPAADFELIAQPLDFFGANIYSAGMVRAGDGGEPVPIPDSLGIGRTQFGWPVTPDALYWGPKFFYERYGKPVVITENGLALSDWVHADGQVHDPQRIDFLRRYIGAFRRAAEDGVDAAGYFQWSLMDNFEWAEGYRYRFGLVHVDYATQARTPKDSAAWYRTVIASNGESL